MNIQNYCQPTSIAQALEDMASSDRVRALAGGTDLNIALHERTLKLDTIVDLSDVVEMKGISLQSDGLHIGAMTTFTEIAESELVRKYCPMLCEAASEVGSPLIRNIGTIGGNLANAATAADTVPVLMAADAIAVIVSTAGKRTLPVTEIPTGLNQTCLSPNELILELILPQHDGCVMAFEKVGRRKALAISRINMGLVLQVKDGTISHAAIAYGAVGKTAYRAQEVEDFLIGKKLNSETVEGAAKIVDAMVVEKLQGRKTTPYKRKIAAAVLRCAMERMMGGEAI